MRRLFIHFVVFSFCFAGVARTRADSAFAGVLLSGPCDGAVLGNFTLTVSHGQVSFESTLFQYGLSGATLEPVLEVQQRVIPFHFGTGTSGNWTLPEFLGPLPCASGAPPACGYHVIDPGFGILPTADGTRFTGSFTAFPGLENLLRVKGGTLHVQVHGTNESMQDTLFSATLLPTTPAGTEQFIATLTAANDARPSAGTEHGTATFTLTGNCLDYTIVVDAFIVSPSSGVFISRSPNVPLGEQVAGFDFLFGIIIPGNGGTPSQLVYSGSVGLSDDAIKLLKRGKLCTSLSTTAFVSLPSEGIRGQILPVEVR